MVDVQVLGAVWGAVWRSDGLLCVDGTCIRWTCKAAYKSIYNVFVMGAAWVCGAGRGRFAWVLLRLRAFPPVVGRGHCRRFCGACAASPDVRQGVGPVQLRGLSWAAPVACDGASMLCGGCPGGDGDGAGRGLVRGRWQ